MKWNAEGYVNQKDEQPINNGQAFTLFFVSSMFGEVGYCQGNHRENTGSKQGKKSSKESQQENGEQAVVLF